MSLLVSIIISLLTGVVGGVASGYFVARYFEFHAIMLPAMLSMRLFARDEIIAAKTLDDLQAVRDQLIVRGFGSAEASLNEIITWARKHMNARTVEVLEKRERMMPFMESIRPTLRELLQVS